MKNAYIFTTLLIITSSAALFGQVKYFSFENNDTLYSKNIRFDTLGNPNNIWEAGKPMKQLFDSSYFSSRSIITDSVNTYPINDTSVFYIHLFEKTDDYPYLEFKYKTDSDSLKDFGRVEVSADSGNTWIDVLEERLTYNFSIYCSTTYPPLDLFTGKRTYWLDFGVSVPDWDDTFNNSESAIFRISFISDSIETNQEGWMIDDMFVGWDFYKSISEEEQKSEISVYPNPATEVLNIEITPRSLSAAEIIFELYDILGKRVLSKALQPNQNTFNVQHLPSGVYTYKIGVTWGQVVIK